MFVCHKEVWVGKGGQTEDSPICWYMDFSKGSRASRSSNAIKLYSTQYNTNSGSEAAPSRISVRNFEKKKR